MKPPSIKKGFERIQKGGCVFFNVIVFNYWLLISSVFQLLWFPPRVAVVSEGVVGLDGACGNVFLSGPQ